MGKTPMCSLGLVAQSSAARAGGGGSATRVWDLGREPEPGVGAAGAFGNQRVGCLPTLSRLTRQLPAQSDLLLALRGAAMAFN